MRIDKLDRFERIRNKGKKVKKLVYTYHKDEDYFIAKVPIKIHEKMQWFIDKAKGEIGGMGTFTVVDNLNIVVDSLELIKCDAGQLHTQPEPIELRKWLDRNGYFSGKKNGVMFWHSHPGFSVEPSAIDEDTFKNLSASAGFSLSIIGNKDGKRDTRVFFMRDGKFMYTPGKYKVDYPDSLSKSDLEEMEKEFSDKVVEKDYSYECLHKDKDYKKDKWFEKGDSRFKRRDIYEGPGKSCEGEDCSIMVYSDYKIEGKILCSRCTNKLYDERYTN